MSPGKLAVWYAQLASFTRAGVPIPTAVNDAFGPPLASRRRIAERLLAGDDPRAVWPEAGPWLDDADALVLAAGQLSGRFPESCFQLAERHKARSRLRMKLLVGALYPVFLIHFALAVAPFIHDVDFSGNAPAASLAQILTAGAIGAVRNLALLWLVAGAGWFACSRSPALRVRLVRLLPLWSGAMRHTALATFAGTLASLLRAGVGIGQAWEFAGRASGDPRIAAAGAKVAALVETRSEPPGKILPELSVFPQNFTGLYLAGERSGSLEERLDELRERHEADAALRSTLAAFAYPMLLTGIVMLLVAARIVAFWAHYFDEIIKMAQ